jgi:choline dehydrogenase-like flavoprotein
MRKVAIVTDVYLENVPRFDVGRRRIENLRIVDGSIMPRVTTGNIMAPCIIIGERAAEILREEHKL